MRLLIIRHGQTPCNVSGELDTAYPGSGLHFPRRSAWPTDQRIKIAELEPFWDPDGSIGTELRRTQSGEVAKF